jgi:hypothetical protein
MEMDYWAAIRHLQLEKQRLDKAIATLEGLSQGGSATPSRRGRKGMPDEERKKVSERMKRYWASRRNHSAPEEP